MRLVRTDIVKSPDADDRVRLCGEVIYDDKTLKPEELWFEVPQRYADFLSRSGNPWLACLAPMAATVGEPLQLCAPVDRVLLENVQELMHIWKCWYPYLHVVPIEAEMLGVGEVEPPGKTVAFFSGGVDSFFTVLRHDTNSNGHTGPQTHIDDLLCIWGYNIHLSDPDAFHKLGDTLQRVASDLNKEYIQVSTNLKETPLRKKWGALRFPGVLPSVGLALENRYSKVLIASAFHYTDLRPFPTHPLTDPMFSTSRTKIVHDGAAFTRVEKTQLLSTSEIAMHSLRVCNRRGFGDRNCSRCGKCYATMSTLEVLGVLDRCPAFNKESFSVERMAKMNISPGDDVHGFYPHRREIKELALKRGREDIANAIDRSLTRSMRHARLMKLSRSYSKWPFVSRVMKALAIRVFGGVNSRKRNPRSAFAGQRK